jgi:hypothetical protein
MLPLRTTIQPGPGARPRVATFAARHRGVLVVGPGEGETAEGEWGPGRMAEPEEIYRRCRDLLGESDSLAGRRVLADFRPDDRLPDAALVVDAALGYSQRGSPTGEVARLIHALPDAPVLALDVPTGLELEACVLHEPHVHAAETLTLALPKQALRDGNGGDVVGDLYLADISVPPAVYEKLGVKYESPFARNPIVRIEPG